MAATVAAQVKKAVGQAVKSNAPAIKRGLLGAGSAAGAALGARLGSPTAGAVVGRSLAARMSRIIGSGDYTVSPPVVSNSLLGGSRGSALASFGTSDHGMRLRHREYVKDILSGPTAGTFSIEGLPINPAMSETFPFLANLASNFEEYKFHGLVFEFVSSTSPYNANAAMGTLILSMEYNAAASAFTSKPQMENSAFAVSSRFDTSMLYGVECATNANNAYYTRTGSSATPINLTDVGTMYIASQPASSFPINSTLGELWVTYDVELSRPRIATEQHGLYSAVVATGVAGSQTLVPTTVYEATGALIGVVATYEAGPQWTNFSVPNAILGHTYLVTYVGSSTANFTTSGTLAVVTGFSFSNAEGLDAPNGGQLGQHAFQTTAKVLSFGIKATSADSHIFRLVSNTTTGTPTFGITIVDLGVVGLV